MKDVERYDLFPDDMSRQDIVQNLVDIWREGPTRIERMRASKAAAERDGLIYYPKHKHHGNNITEKNYQDLMSIIYAND